VSTYKAIAGVSSTLKALLRDRMTEAAEITLAPPDVKVDSVGGRRLNLYLYHVSENPYLKNQEIPGEGYPGAYGSPPLSVDLRYICTAFGSTETGPDADIEAQRILGDAMRVLHDTPIITPDLVEEKKPAPKPPVLDPSLIGEYEQVKVTWQPAALDEISKVWTALPNVNFRRSVLYEVSVVQVQSKKARSIALPVKSRKVYALPLRTPLIQQIFRQPPIGNQLEAAVEGGETLRLIGANLRGAVTRVGMDGVAGVISSITDSQIDVVAPAGALRIGLHSIDVEHDILLDEVDGQPPVQRLAFRSNLAGFLLLPKLGTVTPPGATAGDTVTAQVQPAVAATQEKVLLLGDVAISAVPVDFDAAPSTTIDFKLPKAPDREIPAGTYFVRLRVDGAESRLTFNTVTLAYTGPNYTVT
jgi:Pvc16 N-terminal domain